MSEKVEVLEPETLRRMEAMSDEEKQAVEDALQQIREAHGKLGASIARANRPLKKFR